MFIKEDFKMDFNKIKEAAQNYEADMTKFLREIVKFPGESCGEKDHIERIAEEMRKLDFDKVEIDPQGNVLGYMGTGETLIGFDAHIDTVGIGNRDNWEFDPYEGFESDTEIGGRGTSDQLGGIVSAVYGARIMKDLGLLQSLSQEPYRKKTATASAGNTSSTKIKSVRNLWYPQNRLTAGSTADREDVWRFVWTSKVYPVTALHRSVETMQSTRWLISCRMSVH